MAKVRDMKNRTATGFTLIELMVTLSIAAIIMGIAIPGFTQFIRSNRMAGVTNDFLTAISIARAEAIKNRAPTALCFTTTPNATTPACDGDGTTGWIVFVDDADPTTAAATDGNLIVNTGEPIVLRHGPLPSTISIQNSSPSTNDGYIAYMPSGFARKIAAFVPVSSFVLCDSGGALTARGFELTTVGRPRIIRSNTEVTALGGCS